MTRDELMAKVGEKVGQILSASVQATKDPIKRHTATILGSQLLTEICNLAITVGKEEREPEVEALRNEIRNTRILASGEIRDRRTWFIKYHSGREDIRSTEITDLLEEIADSVAGNSP